jgi:hypothetical protein
MIEKPLTQREFAVKITTLPKNWRTISNKIKRKNGTQCSRCRFHKENLIVHHKDQDQSNNNPSNLVVMCKECHASIPTEPIEELYKKYLTAKYPHLDVVAYMDSQPRSTGEEKSTKATPRSPKRGRPLGATQEARERRELRHRDFKSNKEWEEWWQKHTHPLCKKCINDCKQSARVRIIACPQFEEK